MHDWWPVGFLVGFLLVIVNSRVDIDSALSLAHCRATCIYKMSLTKMSDQDCRDSYNCSQMSLTKMSDQDCRDSYNCSQCWNICRRLQKSKSVCDRTDCVGSCRESCNWVSAGLSPSPLLTQPLEELSFTPTSVSWPLLASTAPNTVYVVMLDHQQYLQTLDLKAKLPLDVNPLTVQVLVVDWRGFTEVFTPRPQSPVELARTLVKQLGLENVIGLNDKVADINRTLETNEGLLKDSYKHPWRLKEESRTYNRDFAKIDISWKHHTTLEPMYLVMWQVEGGLLRGNLLTNTSRATLSIGYNAFFRIQVSLFTQDSSIRSSEFMVIDTRHPPIEHPHLFFPTQLIQPIIKVTRNTLWEMLVAGTTAIVMVVFLTLVWRYHVRWSQSHYKLIHSDVGAPLPFIESSPKTKLCFESGYKTDEFSSTKNLLEAKITDNQYNRK